MEQWIELDEAYSQCASCLGIVLNPEQVLNPVLEKSRYLEHNNDVHDRGYQNFVRPLSDFVLNNVSQADAVLDFGSGTAPVISHLLGKNGYQPNQYDPYFAPAVENLEKTYTAITACEVVEHFVHPRKSYQLLFDLLDEKGYLILKTSLYDESIDFSTWRYRRDPTHTFIHHRKTLEVIEQLWDWKLIEVSRERIVYQKTPTS